MMPTQSNEDWSVGKVLFAFIRRLMFAGMLALSAVWAYGKWGDEHSALDKPLAQTSLNELFGGFCGGVLFGGLFCVFAWFAVVFAFKAFKGLITLE